MRLICPPSLPRQLACNVYECMLLIALLFVAALPFVVFTMLLPPDLGLILRESVLWIYLFGIAGLYFTFFWRKGQTLAMKTWGIKLVSASGKPLSKRQLWLRYLLACLNLLVLGWWVALLRQDRQFLQDHFAGTRLERN